MMPRKRHIRFGVLCSDSHLCTWQESLIKKLMAEADVELKLAVFENECQVATVSSNNRVSKGGFLWTLYEKHWIKKKSRALKKVETKLLFEGIPKIRCKFINVDGLTQLKATDIERIEEAKIDFLLDFTSTRFSGAILNSAASGIWSFRFGDLEKYAGHASCFWEIYHKDLVTSAYLIRLTDESDMNSVLWEGHLKTDILHHKNLDNIHFECTAWPLKVCQDIRNSRTKDLTTYSKTEFGRAVLPPTNIRLLTFFLIQIKLLVMRGYKALFYTDYWNIGLSFSPIHEFLSPGKTPVVQWFTDLPKTRFMADPFGIYIKDNLYVLYEDLLFDQGIGKIASFLFKNGSFTENRIVIDEKFHMSYPFLLEHDEEIYCIPETYQANQVRLYKALEFPGKWNLEKVLIENYAGIDSTLYKHKDIWFLFSTNKNSGVHYNLNIHYSNSILGPWKEHPKNPVKTDIRSARPAGTLFEHKDNLYRPSMDYSEKVEGRIVINKILKLSTDDFKEEFHNFVNPFEDTYFSDKTHTLSRVGPYTLVDGAKELFIFRNFDAFKYKIFRIIQKLSRK